MSLLNFGGSEPRNSGSKKPLKFILGIGALVGVIALGSTLAASINLNSGSPVEFGQGVAQTTACSGDNSIIVTPTSKFINAEEAGAYYYNSVRLSDIPAECQGVDFKIVAYDLSGNSIRLTTDCSDPGKGDKPVIHFGGSNSTHATTATSNEMYTSITQANSTSFTLTWANGSDCSSSALAENVYRITIESSLIINTTHGLEFTNDVYNLIEYAGYGQAMNVTSDLGSLQLSNGAGLMSQVRADGESLTLHYGGGSDYDTTVDVSGLNETDGIVYGDAIATFDFLINGKNARLHNVYHIVSGSSYVEITSTFSNMDSSGTLTEIGLTVGNNDTMVGSDSVYFKRGTITGSGFTTISNKTDRSNAITASSDGVNEILFSKSTTSNSKWDEGCCSATVIASKNPANSEIESNTYYDGSMALDFTVSDLAPGASYTFTWMFGGASDSQLNSVSSAMFSAAAADSYSP